MTITLHCTHCNQPMAIAPRKPGSRVTCPACGASVTVPGTESHTEPAGPARAASGAAATAGDRGPVVAVAPAAPRTAARPTLPVSPPTPPTVAPRQPAPAKAAGLPAQQMTLPGAPIGLDDAPAALPRRACVTLPTSVVVLSLVFALAALGLAFFAGFLLGKH